MMLPGFSAAFDASSSTLWEELLVSGEDGFWIKIPSRARPDWAGAELCALAISPQESRSTAMPSSQPRYAFEQLSILLMNVPRASKAALCPLSLRCEQKPSLNIPAPLPTTKIDWMRIRKIGFIAGRKRPPMRGLGRESISAQNRGSPSHGSRTVGDSRTAAPDARRTQLCRPMSAGTRTTRRRIGLTVLVQDLHSSRASLRIRTRPPKLGPSPTRNVAWVETKTALRRPAIALPRISSNPT
jgi:hypothetical protein